MFSSRKAAMKSAAKTSVRLGYCYVIYEGDEFHTATEDDLNGFFLGANPIAVFEDGYRTY